MADDSSRMPLDSTRRSDQNLIKITRELPLPWLIAGAIAFAGQAIALYYGQQQQGTALQQQSADIKVLTVKVDSLIDKRNADTIENMKRDNKVERQGERLDFIEGQIKQQSMKGK